MSMGGEVCWRQESIWGRCSCRFEVVKKLRLHDVISDQEKAWIAYGDLDVMHVISEKNSVMAAATHLLVDPYHASTTSLAENLL
jgi:hypothetical protein